MSDETVTPMRGMALPWAKELEVQEVAYESGLQMLRLRFREGRHRFTIVDLDAGTAAELGELLTGWAARNRG